jgi:hypothetical protein
MPGRIEVSDELRSPTGACGSKACEIGKRIRLISPQARRWLEDKSRRKADWTALVNEGLKVATECGQENQLHIARCRDVLRIHQKMVRGMGWREPRSEVESVQLM